MSRVINSICVYGASSPKLNQLYIEDAALLGKMIAKQDISLITGGGVMGLMAAVQEAVISAGGKTIGIIPKFMVDAGWMHNGLTDTIITKDMHERKELMAKMADAFIALPGGTGTFEELLEIITWKQLGICLKPIIILNTNNYYDSLLKQLQESVLEDFLDSRYLKLWQVAKTPAEAIELVFSMPEWDSNLNKLP
jgi:uncharacterized protein (TIGR00730 family)